MMRVIVLRHGEVEENKLGLLVGGRTDAPLNAAGIEVAQKTKSAMDDAGITFDQVYASPLSRTIRTAEILAPSVPIRLDDRLKEVDFGPMELAYAPNLIGVEFGKNGVEPLSDLQSRAMAAWEEILQNLDVKAGKTVLVVTHGTVIRALLARLKGHLDVMSEPGHGNCCATIIDVDVVSGAISIIAENVSFEDT